VSDVSLLILVEKMFDAMDQSSITVGFEHRGYQYNVANM
jgi:hypothetical protein